jgi:GPH family glycoside/pentoside/hexuronide:cation symporter
MENEKILIEEIVPLKSRMWVSAADASVAFIQGTLLIGLSYYYLHIRGLSALLIGIVWLIFGVWNAVNDPLFGHLTDVTKTKLGRRIPYVRYGGPILGFLYILCWIAYPNNDQFLVFLQMLLTLFLYDALYTIVASCLYVLPFEMALSNKARGSIFVWKLIFSVIATFIPLFLIPIIQPGTGDDPTFYILFHVILGIFVGVIVFVSSFFYKERFYMVDEEKVPFLTSVKNTFKNKSFIVFEVISFTIIYVQAGLMLGLGFYIDEFETNMIFLFLGLGVGVIVGAIVFIGQQSKLGVKKSMMLMCAIFALGCYIILFFGHILALVLIGFVCVGMGVVGGFFLIPMMNGEVIDKDEDLTGTRREGMYAGVNSFVTKFAISLAQFIFLIIIAIYGYDATLRKGQQAPIVETGILIAWMLVPALMLTVCVIVMRLYPLHGTEWLQAKVKLAEIHKQKEKAFLEKHGIKYVE